MVRLSNEILEPGNRQMLFLRSARGPRRTQKKQPAAVFSAFGDFFFRSADPWWLAPALAPASELLDFTKDVLVKTHVILAFGWFYSILLRKT